MSPTTENKFFDQGLTLVNLSPDIFQFHHSHLICANDAFNNLQPLFFPLNYFWNGSYAIPLHYFFKMLPPYATFGIKPVKN